ncbi:MAG: hypothetical protein WCO78_02135 [Candidatus Roizmanbacteria bacterium]
MGALIEINDTLRISKAQGFPAELDIKKHLINPYPLNAVEGKEYEFTNKPKIRVYKIPPVRNFLVEDVDGKWLYWGLVHIIEIRHDYINQTTSGKYRIIHLNNPVEMRKAYDLIDRNLDNNYFRT